MASIPCRSFQIGIPPQQSFLSDSLESGCIQPSCPGAAETVGWNDGNNDDVNGDNNSSDDDDGGGGGGNHNKDNDDNNKIIKMMMMMMMMLMLMTIIMLIMMIMMMMLTMINDNLYIGLCVLFASLFYTNSALSA